MGRPSATSVNRWTTDQVGVGERFDYWREALCTNLIGVTAEAPAEHRGKFSGQITRTLVGNTGVAQLSMNLSQLRTDRTARDVRDRPGDGIFLFRATTYHTNFLFHDREGFVARPGAVVMGGLDRQRYSIANKPGSYRCDVLRLPSMAFKDILSEPSLLEPRIVTLQSGADALLHGFFNSFMRELSRLTADEGDAAIDTLVHLATLALRKKPVTAEPVRAAVRTARLNAAQDYLKARATDPTLSAGSVAAALGISARQLHSLFEPTGDSFSRYLMMARVEIALHAIKYETRLTIAEIAYASGFDSLPTFYRAIRTMTGATPSEIRAAEFVRVLPRN